MKHQTHLTCSAIDDKVIMESDGVVIELTREEAKKLIHVLTMIADGGETVAATTDITTIHLDDVAS